MDLELKLPKFQDSSFHRDEEFFNLLSDHSSEELKEIFEKSQLTGNEALSSNLNKFCNDSLSLILENKWQTTLNDSAQLTHYVKNNDIIEKYTKKLLLLQQKLNQNLSEHKIEKENLYESQHLLEISNQPGMVMEKSGASAKIRFKELSGFKKDAAMKKLLKTIDIMNQELGKRDKLIASMEKENKILSHQKHELSSINKVHKLDLDLFQGNARADYFEKEIKSLEDKCAATVSNIHQLGLEGNEHLERLQRVNDELKLKILKVTKSDDVKLKKIELEFNDKFASLIKEKTILEIENEKLTKKVSSLSVKLEETEASALEKCEINDHCHKIELSNLKQELSEMEQKFLKIIANFEERLKDMSSDFDNLEDERNSLVRILNQTQDEKLQLTHQLESHKLTQAKHDELKEKFDTLAYTNFENQNRIQQLLKDLESKNSDTAKKSTKQCDELKRIKQALNLSQEKLKYLQTKHETEMQNVRKQFTRDLEHSKFTSDQMTVKNGELSRSNGELRKKSRQLESDLKAATEKSFVYKQSADLLSKQKREAREEHEKATTNLKKQIFSLERLKDEFSKKNSQQQDSIEQMLQQINSFKTEFEEILKRNSNLEEKFKKLSTQADAYKEKYNQLKQKMNKTSTEFTKSQRSEAASPMGKTAEVDLIKNFMRDLRNNCENHSAGSC